MDERILLKLEEPLTVAYAASLRDRMSKALGKSSELVLDLSRVTEVDTAGFQLLTLFKREAEAQGKGFTISSYSPATLSVLKLYNMEEFFGVDDLALGILSDDEADDDLFHSESGEAG